MKTRLSLLILLLATGLYSCEGNGPSPSDVQPGREDGKEEGTTGSNRVDESLTVNLTRVKGKTVSDRLLGFNLVYANNPDALWADSRWTDAIKAVKPGFLRYPGGTVTTYYHWNSLNGNPKLDSWDPAYNRSQDRDASEYMDLDEYFSVIARTGAEPMLGINCNSAFVYDRLEEGIEEALALMKRARDKGYAVKYWYLGNEPFASDGNGGTWSPEDYAGMVNAFAPRMKAFDPSIKIIVNDHANMVKHSDDYDTILSLAGQWIDVMDVHFYWDHGNATWARWLKHTPCSMSGGNAYEAEVDAMREVARRNGCPDLEFASLEWNCGPSTNATDPLTTAGQVTLIQGEMLMQFMRGGLDIACFWPLFWTGDSAHRGFFDKSSGQRLPIADVMRNYAAFLGKNLVETTLNRTREHVMVLAVQDPSTKRLEVAFLNKNAVSIGVSFAGAVSGSGLPVPVVSYYMDDSLVSICTEERTEASGSPVVVRPFSLTFITL